MTEPSPWPASDLAGPGDFPGVALLQVLIASTEAAGIWTIQSAIFPENTASLRLHEATGFRVIGRHNRIWRDTLLIERRSPLIS